jgi:hypothetical protein
MRRFCFSLLIVLCLAGVGVATVDAQKPVALTSGDEPQRILVAASPVITDPKLADYSIDLRPLLEKKSMGEGETFITRTPEGLRVFVVAENGELTGLVVRDAYGDELDQLEVWGQDRDRRPEGGVSASTAKKEELHCWRCFSNFGETHCFEIVCPTGGRVKTLER